MKLPTPTLTHWLLDDGTIDTKVLAKLLAAGITEKWPALSKFSESAMDWDALVALLDGLNRAASNPDPDALAEILFKIQDALDPTDDGTFDTKVLAKLLSAGSTEKWPTLSEFSEKNPGRDDILEQALSDARSLVANAILQLEAQQQPKAHAGFKGLHVASCKQQ